MAREIVIKSCLKCGYTKRMDYSRFECPDCGTMSLVFFTSETHLINYINLYGLGIIKLKEHYLLERVIESFNGEEEENEKTNMEPNSGSEGISGESG